MAIGNYLNGGTARGGIYGFKLEGLLKLPTIKSVDNKLSLIHFVSMHCESTDAELLRCERIHVAFYLSYGSVRIDQELSMVEDASRISLDQCRSEISTVIPLLSVYTCSFIAEEFGNCAGTNRCSDCREE